MVRHAQCNAGQEEELAGRAFPSWKRVLILVTITLAGRRSSPWPTTMMTFLVRGGFMLLFVAVLIRAGDKLLRLLGGVIQKIHEA